MTTSANDNILPVGPGLSYYPEMGERSDGTALFHTDCGYGGYYVKWIPARNDEALAVFKSHRIRPRAVTLSEQVSGGFAWSAIVTFAAGQKLRPYSANQILLD